MRSEIILAGAMVAAAVVGVRVLDARTQNDQDPGAHLADHRSPGANQPAVMNAASFDPKSGWRNEVKITAARDNQFYVNAAVNMRSAHFLVDTGASYVAMRDADARAAGIYTAWTDFNYPVRTANGETKAALVTLDEMEIGDIRVENVKAFILPDDQLSVNLLGMSFLSRLESVEARAGELVLRG